MRSILSLFALLVLVLVAGAPAPVAAQPGHQPAEIHVPVPTGWTAVDDEYRYGRDNLWEYINGAAELFLTYRFQELIVADFEQGDRALSVSVYNMSRPLDAFGVFESEKPNEAELLDGMGSAAVLQPPYRGLLLKDKFYVKVEAGGGDITSEMLRQAMADIAAGLPGNDELPPQLAALPAAGRVPGTVAFAGANFLGLNDLTNCLHANYKTAEGVEYRLFVMAPSKAFLKNEKGRWTTNDHDDGLLFQRQIPYTGAVVLLGDQNQLLGVSGLEDVSQATKLLESLLR